MLHRVAPQPGRRAECALHSRLPPLPPPVAPLPALQVGTEDGRVKLIGQQGVEATMRSGSSRAGTRHLCFLPNRGAILRVNEEGEIQLFSVPACRLLTSTWLRGDPINAAALLPEEDPYLLLGCESGNVRVVALLDDHGMPAAEGTAAADLALQPYQGTPGRRRLPLLLLLLVLQLLWVAASEAASLLCWPAFYVLPQPGGEGAAGFGLPPGVGSRESAASAPCGCSVLLTLPPPTHAGAAVLAEDLDAKGGVVALALTSFKSRPLMVSLSLGVVSLGWNEPGGAPGCGCVEGPVASTAARTAPQSHQEAPLSVASS